MYSGGVVDLIHISSPVDHHWMQLADFKKARLTDVIKWEGNEQPCVYNRIPASSTVHDFWRKLSIGKQGFVRHAQT